MSPPLSIFALSLAAAVLAAAEPPRKAPISRYSNLWTNSPFTSKPPPEQQAAELNPLDDYALVGVSPITGGYRVTLINRKNPDERITVDSGGNSPFKILAVSRKAGNPLGTTVRMSHSGREGSVAFDETLLTLRPPAAPQPGAVPQPEGIPHPPGGQPVPDGSGAAPRQPRPRVVPNPQQPNQAQGAPTGNSIPAPQPANEVRRRSLRTPR